MSKVLPSERDNVWGYPPRDGCKKCHCRMYTNRARLCADCRQAVLSALQHSVRLALPPPAAGASLDSPPLAAPTLDPEAAGFQFLQLAQRFRHPRMEASYLNWQAETIFYKVRNPCGTRGAIRQSAHGHCCLVCAVPSSQQGSSSKLPKNPDSGYVAVVRWQFRMPVNMQGIRLLLKPRTSIRPRVLRAAECWHFCQKHALRQHLNVNRQLPTSVEC